MPSRVNMRVVVHAAPPFLACSRVLLVSATISPMRSAYRRVAVGAGGHVVPRAARPKERPPRVNT